MAFLFVRIIANLAPSYYSTYTALRAKTHLSEKGFSKSRRELI